MVRFCRIAPLEKKTPNCEIAFEGGTKACYVSALGPGLGCHWDVAANLSRDAMRDCKSRCPEQYDHEHCLQNDC